MSESWHADSDGPESFAVSTAHGPAGSGCVRLLDCMSQTHHFPVRAVTCDSTKGRRITSDCCWRPSSSLARSARPAYDVRSRIAEPLCGCTKLNQRVTEIRSKAGLRLAWAALDHLRVAAVVPQLVPRPRPDPLATIPTALRNGWRPQTRSSSLRPTHVVAGKLEFVTPRGRTSVRTPAA